MHFLFSDSNNNFFLISIALAITIAIIILWELIRLLRRLINQQVSDQFEKFAKEAKIPTFVKKRVQFKINWR